MKNIKTTIIQHYKIKAIYMRSNKPAYAYAFKALCMQHTMDVPKIMTLGFLPTFTNFSSFY